MAVDHPYSHPLPALAARVAPAEGDSVDLPAAYDTTEPVEHGYRTELVFDVDRGLNAPGAEVEIAVRLGDRVRTDRLALFGETVEETLMRWVPIETATVPAVDDLGDEGYTDVLDAYMPIGEYSAIVTEPLAYEPTGNEQEGAEIDDRAVGHQMKMLQTVEGCGNGEIYVGVYNRAGLRDAGVLPRSATIRGGAGVMVLAGGADYEATAERDYQASSAHEFAHARSLGSHFSCPHHEVPPPDPDRPYHRDDYPYEDGRMGPARGWHRLAGDFVERGVPVRRGPREFWGDEAYDIMTPCVGTFVSDFTYQMVLAYQQAPFHRRRVERARACPAEREAGGAAHRTLAVMGEVRDDGAVAVLDMAVSDRPPWAPPTAAPPGTRLWTVELRDAAGGVAHRQAVPARGRGGDGPAARVWSYRMPYPAAAETVVVRDPSGALRAADPIACPGCGNVGAR